MIVNHTTTLQRGISLIESAAVVMIVGLLLVASVRLTKPYWEIAQIDGTYAKMEAIDKALAQFARQYGRLPCPSNPVNRTVIDPVLGNIVEEVGFPRGAGPNGINVTARCLSTVADNSTAGGMGNFYGVVPFRTLGLRERDVRDGWGNYITYAVSPIAAGRDENSLPTVAPNNQIHAYCRQRHWLDRDVTLTGVNHLNLRKANLCCPYFDSNSGVQTNNIFITDASGASVLIPAQSTDVGDYNTPTTLVTSTSPLALAATTNTATATATSQFIAYALVSHGRNGSGAFTGQVAPPQYTPAGMGINETENSDLDATFVFRDLSTNIGGATGYFDDLISWKTNHQIVSLFRNDSCSSPYPIVGDR
jgi:type II secretory pathway pseudopilin PulG